jgi:hypothetical protein
MSVEIFMGSTRLLRAGSLLDVGDFIAETRGVLVAFALDGLGKIDLEFAETVVE